MGSGISFPWTSLKKKKVVMIGLDAAGKTTILYKLKLNTVVNTIPTIGFNVEEVKIHGFTMLMWDLGGQIKLRPLWHHYLSKANAIIFVLDSADEERIDSNERSARQELDNVLSDAQADGIPLLVLANKQDMTGALSVSAIEDRLRLRDYKDRKWHIQGASATDPKDTGIMKGLQWLSDELTHTSKPGLFSGLFSRRKSTETDDVKSPLSTPRGSTPTTSTPSKPVDEKHSTKPPLEVVKSLPVPHTSGGGTQLSRTPPKDPVLPIGSVSPKPTKPAEPSSDRKEKQGAGAGAHRRTRSHVPDSKKDKYATLPLSKDKTFSKSEMEIDQEKDNSDSSPSPSPKPGSKKKKKKVVGQSQTLQRPLHFHYENNKKSGT